MKLKKQAAIEWSVTLADGKRLKGVICFRDSFTEAAKLADQFNDRYKGVIRHKVIHTNRMYE